MLLAVSAITACTAALAIDTAAHKILVQEEVNFREKNFATADYLISQAQAFIKSGDLIVAEPFLDRRQPGMESEIRTMVPEQIGTRMAQLGYNVDLRKVTFSPETAYLKPAQNQLNEPPKFILTGNFLRQRRDVNVNIRLVEAQSEKIVATFDYTVPLTRDVGALAEPQPQIIRMNAQQ